MVWSCSGHSPPLSHTGQSSGWFTSRNSRIPSWAFFTFGLFVTASMPGATSMKQAGCKLEPLGPFQVDEAHPAHTHRLHAGVVTKTGDVRPSPLGGGDEHLALLGSHLTPVEGDSDAFGLDVRGYRCTSFTRDGGWGLLAGLHGIRHKRGSFAAGRAGAGKDLAGCGPGTRRGTCGSQKPPGSGSTAREGISSSAPAAS